MDNIPDSALGALARRMSEEEELSEHEIACELADDDGGVFWLARSVYTTY